MHQKNACILLLGSLAIAAPVPEPANNDRPGWDFTGPLGTISFGFGGPRYSPPFAFLFPWNWGSRPKAWGWSATDFFGTTYNAGLGGVYAETAWDKATNGGGGLLSTVAGAIGTGIGSAVGAAAGAYHSTSGAAPDSDDSEVKVNPRPARPRPAKVQPAQAPPAQPAAQAYQPAPAPANPAKPAYQWVPIPLLPVPEVPVEQIAPYASSVLNLADPAPNALAPPTEETPSDFAPAVSDVAPAVSEVAPATTEAAPAVTEAAPVVSEVAPAAPAVQAAPAAAPAVSIIAPAQPAVQNDATLFTDPTNYWLGQLTAKPN